MAQAYVRWAREKMLQDIQKGKSLGSRTLNRCVAHRLFCWVFSEAYPGTDPPSAWDESRPGSRCLNDGAACEPDGHADQNAASVIAYDVAIVYEPLRDSDRIAARGLHQVLQKVCGLETWYMDKKDVTRLELEKAVDDATLVVFICSGNDMSPEYESCVSTSDRYHVKCVTMDDTADLPAPLQGRYPTVTWTSDLAVQAARRKLTTETHLDSVCRLFCSLANVPMTQF